MDVVKCLYAIGSVVILLVGQVSAAPLAAVAEAGIVAPPPGFILKMDTTTDDLGKTTTSASPIVKSVTDLQYAIKWFRSYKYLPQEEGIECEKCDPAECAVKCLVLLKDLAVVPLVKFQKFYDFTPTGILTNEDLIQMEEPRCGDVDKEDGEEHSSRKKRWARLGSTVWPADLMPLKISVNGGVKGFSVDQVEAIALECAKMWAEPSSISFQLATRGQKGNIDITFQRIDGPWNTVGLGLSPMLWGEKSSYLKLDRDETWKRDALANGYGVSLKWAICHEMGHNLGLSHSTDKNAIMYPSGIGQNERQLPRDDHNGITNLYRGRNGKTIFGRAPVVRPPPHTTRRTTRRTTTRTTPRPVWRTTRHTTRRTTPRVITRAPTQPRRPPTTSSYRYYKPESERRYAPPGYKPRYRPGSPAARPDAQPNYWQFDNRQGRYVRTGR